MSRILIEKARRLLEREKGTIYKPLEGRLRFALAFPSCYRLGMSSLGYQIVYGLINSIHAVVCERVFLPEPEDALEFRRSRTRLFTLESQTAVSEFDVLAFSISYEMNYTGVAEILDLAGLPVFAADRDESHPLIIAGGPCATFNPEPLADIIDAFAVGEAEEIVFDIVRTIQETSPAAGREDLLAKLAQIPGIYVPRFYSPRCDSSGRFVEMQARPPAPDKVTRRIVFDLNRYSNLSIVTTPEAEFSDMLFAEVVRGCKRQCRFCLAGYTNLPMRQREIPESPNGARIGLVGSAVFDHSDASEICQQLTNESREFSVSSIRIETLTPELAQMMYHAGQRTMTIAPEAGTDSLRRVINKPTGEEEIFGAAKMASDAGFQRLKLYFMLGLPTETDEDVDAIATIAKEISACHPQIRIQVSISCYVPKPWTPFQWCGMLPEKELGRRLSRIRKQLAGSGRIELSTESPRGAYVQAWLARGDRRLGKVIASAVQDGISLTRAARLQELDTAAFAARERSRDEAFPWDHIDMLVKKDYLWKEYERALAGRVTPSCNTGACVRCGVCS